MIGLCAVAAGSSMAAERANIESMTGHFSGEDNAMLDRPLSLMVV